MATTQAEADRLSAQGITRLTDHTRIYDNFINSRSAAGRAVTGVRAVNQYRKDEAEVLEQQDELSILEEIEEGYLELEATLDLWLDFEEIKEVQKEIQNKAPDQIRLEYFERMLEQDNNLALMLKDIIDRHGAKVLAQRKNKTQDLNSKISRIEVELREKERIGARLKKANQALEDDNQRLQQELNDYESGTIANEHELTGIERTRADKAEVEVNRVRTELETAKVEAVNEEKTKTAEWKAMYDKAETARNEAQMAGESYLTEYQTEAKKFSTLDEEMRLLTAQQQNWVARVQALEADVSRFQLDISHKDQSIDSQKVIIKRKDTQIEELQNQYAAQKSKIDELNFDMLNKDETHQLGSKELDTVKEDLRQKTHEKELVAKDLEHANDDLASLEKKADKYEEEINASRAMVKTLESRLEGWHRVVLECGFFDASWKSHRPAITHVLNKITNTFWPIRERDIAIAATNMLDAITKSQGNDISTPESAGICALRMWIMAYVCPVRLDCDAMQVFLRALTIEASYQRSILGFSEATLEVLLSQDMSADTVLFVLRGIEMLMLTSTIGPRRRFACQMLEQVKDKIPTLPLWQALNNWLTDESRGINSGRGGKLMEFATNAFDMGSGMKAWKEGTAVLIASQETIHVTNESMIRLELHPTDNVFEFSFEGIDVVIKIAVDDVKRLEELGDCFTLP